MNRRPQNKREEEKQTQRLGLRIDKDLHKSLKLRSVQEDISMNLLVENILRDYLEE